MNNTIEMYNEDIPFIKNYFKISTMPDRNSPAWPISAYEWFNAGGWDSIEVCILYGLYAL